MGQKQQGWARAESAGEAEGRELQKRTKEVGLERAGRKGQGRDGEGERSMRRRVRGAERSELGPDGGCRGRGQGGAWRRGLRRRRQRRTHRLAVPGERSLVWLAERERGRLWRKRFILLKPRGSSASDMVSSDSAEA